MEDISEHHPLWRQTVLECTEQGLKKYSLQTKRDFYNEEDRIQVLSVGCPCDAPTKCVLLLGETGAGKTTVINAFINFLYGTQFEDGFRLQLKDQVVGEERGCTESQTDYITAYRLYHQQGMQYTNTFILIDTPGLADTRGHQQQDRVARQLETFLSSDCGIDDLHCIGLVAKANTNRNFTFQKDILGLMTSLLGNNVSEITNVFATFAVETPVVDQIVRNAGVVFNRMYSYDNGVLVVPHGVSDNLRPRDRAMLAYRWERMTEEYSIFFHDLMHAPAISMKVIKEKKLLDMTLKLLKSQVEDLAESLCFLELCKKMAMKFHLQVAQYKDWQQQKQIKRKIRVGVEEGFHAHNCQVCEQTCIFPCPPERDHDRAGLIGSVAGVVGGTAAGAVVAQATASSIAAATRVTVTSSPGIAATVGGWVTRALGGTAAAVGVEMGSVGGLPAMVVGGLVGVAMGTVAGTVYGKVLTPEACQFPGRGDVCGERGCLHSLSQHVLESERITDVDDVEIIVDNDMKMNYDDAHYKYTDALNKIMLKKQKIVNYKKLVGETTIRILSHITKIEEMGSSVATPEAQVLFGQLCEQARLGNPQHLHFTIQILENLQEGVDKLAAADTDQVDDYALLVQALDNIPYPDYINMYNNMSTSSV